MAAVLFAPLSIAAAQPARSAASGDITLRVGDKATHITRAMLNGLTERSLRIADITDSSTIGGVDLWDVLQLGKAVSDQASGRQRAVMYVKVTGADGQSAAIALVEIDPSFSKRRAILVSKRNGQPIDATEGPWATCCPGRSASRALDQKCCVDLGGNPALRD